MPQPFLGGSPLDCHHFGRVLRQDESHASSLRQSSPRNSAGALTSLHPPVQPVLARPGALHRDRLAGGEVAYEPKWDGLRCLAFRHESGVVLQAGRSQVVTRAFPEVASAVCTWLPPGTVVDGELVAWSGNRLDVAVLYGRLGASTTRAAAAASERAVSFVMFDLLLCEHRDLRPLPYVERRTALEELTRAAAPPLSATAVTTDPAEAARWYDELPAMGFEGVVVKPLNSQYLSGQRIWRCARRQVVTTVVVGGVLGNPSHPVALVVGRFEPDGSLGLVGATRPLPDAVRRQLGPRLRRATSDHPWPPTPLPPAWIGRTSPAEHVCYIRVVPEVAVEVVVDEAWPGTRWGHPAELSRVLDGPAPGASGDEVPTVDGDQGLEGADGVRAGHRATDSDPSEGGPWPQLSRVAQ